MLTGGFALLTSVLAFMGARWMVASQRPSAAPIAGAAGAPSAAPAATTAAQQAAQQAAPNADMVIALNDPGLQNQARGANAARGAQPSRAGAAGKPKKELTEEQKAMLARMGGGDSSSVANLRPAMGATGSASAAHGTGGLTADQLSKVVLRGRENLQRCYETALRGSGSTETVRMDVEIAVSPAGNVTSAKVNGQGLPGMSQCIERTVRMWRFPNAGEVTQTKFPVVFQPGS
jgi:hypothetical protein